MIIIMITLTIDYIDYIDHLLDLNAELVHRTSFFFNLCLNKDIMYKTTQNFCWTK